MHLNAYLFMVYCCDCTVFCSFTPCSNLHVTRACIKGTSTLYPDSFLCEWSLDSCQIVVAPPQGQYSEQTYWGRLLPQLRQHHACSEGRQSISSQRSRSDFSSSSSSSVAVRAQAKAEAARARAPLAEKEAKLKMEQAEREARLQLEKARV